MIYLFLIILCSAGIAIVLRHVDDKEDQRRELLTHIPQRFRLLKDVCPRHTKRLRYGELANVNKERCIFCVDGFTK